MKENHTQYHGAHSGSRSGISDYNDGGNISHYNGNDETDNLDNRPAFVSGSYDECDGKTAFGNDLDESDLDTNDYLEFEFRDSQTERALHSGL